MARRRIERWVRLATGNPFGDDAPEWPGAITKLLDADAPRFIAERLDDGHVKGAQLAVLALAHAQAVTRDADPKRVLDESALPPRLARQLPRSRAAYARIALASARCFRALARVRGSSSALQRVRRDTWAACFGESLLHALTLETVIREHDVVILGESGTGKEAIAHAIQEGTAGGDDGRAAPRGALNAAAVPETLVESELFGHVKGAFTGATRDRIGRIRSVVGGCFFLDEVGDLPATAQVKLLRVIELDEVNPIGSDRSHPADVRYVAATHRDLAAMVAAGSFRHDLYQRLAGNVIRLPPLRERPEDIAEIGMAFVERHLDPTDRSLGFDSIRRWLESAEALRHPWPGNVRELQNALRNRMLGLDPGLTPEPTPIPQEPTESLPRTLRDGIAPLSDAVSWYAAHVLARSDDNLSRAARTLGIDRATLRRHLAPRPRE